MRVLIKVEACLACEPYHVRLSKVKDDHVHQCTSVSFPPLAYAIDSAVYIMLSLIHALQ